ncbi:MAG: hypothetical protein E7474_14175 [Ruminococcaceae bacterium]|nr:hypothetical protein [Oscillospiraceae bacterium]
MKHFTRSAALAAVCALVLAVLAPCAAASHYEAFDHPDVAYADMAYTGIDLSAVDAFLEQFARDPLGKYDELIALYDKLSTQSTLAEIESCLHAGDEAASAAYEQATNDFTEASDRIFQAISDALDSPQGGALRALIPEDEEDSFVDYEAASEEDFAAVAQEASLVQQYYLLPDDDNFADAAAGIYLKLAALRRAEAQEAGYDSFAEYAYETTYAREYVPEDAQQLESVVKSRIAPLYVKCMIALSGCDLPWNDEAVPDEATIIDTIAAHIGDVSPELNEAMDFLLRNRLYRIGSGDDLQDMGFTVSLPSYRSAYLFNKVVTRYDAFESTVHEFGHFNAAYHDPTPMLFQYSNIDVSEIQSQGLELLFIPSLQGILADETDEAQRNAVTLYVVTNILSSVVDGCMYDEFEQAVYADPDMTVERLHQLEADLTAEYGLDEIYEAGVYWPYITHLFEQPFYYISYAASALPSLDIWLQSLDDRAAAVDTYLNVSAVRTGEWFLDVLEDNGLCDVTVEGDVRRVADALEARLDPLMENLPASTLGIVLFLLVCLAVVALIVVVIVILVRRGKKKRRERAARQEPPTLG